MVRTLDYPNGLVRACGDLVKASGHCRARHLVVSLHRDDGCACGALRVRASENELEIEVMHEVPPTFCPTTWYMSARLS